MIYLIFLAIDFRMMDFVGCCYQISTCNGRNCGDTFPGPNGPDKPSLWTENWTAQYVVDPSSSPFSSFSKILDPSLSFIAGIECSVTPHRSDLQKI